MVRPFDSSTALSVFDRYAPFTDLAALKDISSKPLRKSMRVNTLKCSVEEFKSWAKHKNWMIEPVPWCAEGFFVDREHRDEALGKDLLHVLGYVYMQEAASMLPVVLLDPKPGETILDMSAAPGSKSTQIACTLTPNPSPDGRGESPTLTPNPSPEGRGETPSTSRAELPFPHRGKGRGDEGGTGILISNDVQEKRIWSLLSNLRRCGIVPSIVTRKVGQWFAGNMTEMFDRVLCDAPCTAQGIARKDSDALTYCSPDNIGKMARLQRELLESAVHAAKVGGRIVYSTCTLTPEENETVVMSVLKKFGDCLAIIDPTELKMDPTSPRLRGARNGKWKMDNAIEDSFKVQHWLKDHCQLSTVNCPFLRLWPQVYDTEGFFCAVLEKRASTNNRGKRSTEPYRFNLVQKSRMREITERLEDWYGTSFLRDDELLIESKRWLCVLPQSALHLRLPIAPYFSGLPFAKVTDHGLPRLSHEIATLRGWEAEKQTLIVSEAEFRASLKGVNVQSAPDGFDDGDILLSVDASALGRSIVFGRGVLKSGTILNRLPREIVKMFT